MNATLTFLGSGTSMGVPTLGCNCAVCRSAVTPAPEGDPRNRRTRPSVWITWGESQNHSVLIDTGPDFHHQAIREKIRHIDAVFYTHPHADHILGMDDLRPLTFNSPEPLPLFADDSTADTIERVFDYTFRPPTRGTTIARVKIHRFQSPEEEIEIFGATFRRVPVNHGNLQISGYRFGSAAYLTDMSSIPDTSIAQLQDLDILVLDALRHTPHPTHSNVENSIKLVEQLRPKRAFFTHMSHDLDHAATDAMLPPHIRLAYDGLKLDFDLTPEMPHDIA